MGVQKCKKIIHDCVTAKSDIYKGEGIDILFKMLQNIYEGREVSTTDKESKEKWVLTYQLSIYKSKINFYSFHIHVRKKPVLSFAGAMSMATTKKKMAAEARENVEIKKEEELTKREKTLLDEEAAEIDREKLQQQK